MTDGDGGVRHPLSHDITGDSVPVTEVTDDFQVWGKKKNRDSISSPGPGNPTKPSATLRHHPPVTAVPKSCLSGDTENAGNFVGELGVVR